MFGEFFPGLLFCHVVPSFNESHHVVMLLPLHVYRDYCRVLVGDPKSAAGGNHNVQFAI